MTDKPGEHPEPHADLAKRSPLLDKLKEGTVIYRLHRADRDAIFFGRTGDNRFDAPDGSYGVLYAGEDEYCSFIETCGQVTGVPSVSGAYLDQRNLAEITVTQSMSLIDLSASAGLARIGADGRLMSGSHAVAQRWSAALRKHPTNPGGILYRARHDPAKSAFAIFECPTDVFQVTSRGSLRDPRNLKLLGQILNHDNFGVIDPSVAQVPTSLMRDAGTARFLTPSPSGASPSESRSQPSNCSAME